MHRRRLLTSIGALASTVGVAGCLAGREGASGNESTESLPEACPVDTLQGVDPPAEVDRESAMSFVERYEEAYIERTAIDRDQYDRVEGPGSSVESVTTVDDGYRLDVETFWGTWEPDRAALEFDAVGDVDDDTVDAEPDATYSSAFEGNETLRDPFEEAIDENRTAVLPEAAPEYRATRDRLDAAAGQVDGVVIDYRGELVRVSDTSVPGVHGDHYRLATYFVASGIVYRTEDDTASPREGTPVECRSP
ncbi:hypothetical protein RH858_10995 [Halalkaliarchaeum sp. AArc-GB]|uniref:hypothetical protein n=1 Tax=Halalkaliarchaeum sp. AArc-GB TaxID=3074078 RepID=UPI002863D034|nr:hypothetical protein [Halalkaliarchaeum sp. AArc-GB]MDR5673666.1 hypothetical protein [Halalkaliarchaeum sp. AArc-GB]